MPLHNAVRKDVSRDIVLRQYSLIAHPRALILIDIHEKEISDFLQEGLHMIGATSVLIDTPGSLDHITGYDACITDGKNNTLDIPQMIQSGVVPILPEDTPYAKILREFDPMKFEGNAFLFASIDKYRIFEKVIRYLENIRYVGDKRTLLTNLAKTL